MRTLYLLLLTLSAVFASTPSSIIQGITCLDFALVYASHSYLYIRESWGSLDIATHTWKVIRGADNVLAENPVQELSQHHFNEGNGFMKHEMMRLVGASTSKHIGGTGTWKSSRPTGGQQVYTKSYPGTLGHAIHNGIYWEDEQYPTSGNHHHVDKPLNLPGKMTHCREHDKCTIKLLI